jgi:hypothetical protein
MAETSGPWSGVDWTQADWDEAFSLVVADGILQSVRNECEVYANSVGMVVHVKSGDAWLAGRKYKNDAELDLTIATANVSNPRIDLVVLRMDYTAKTVHAAVKTGTASGSPSAPALQQDTAIWEIPLAEVRVDAGVSTIAAGKVTDRRVMLGGSGQRVMQTGVATLHWSGSLRSGIIPVTFDTPFTATPTVIAGAMIYGNDALVHAVVIYDIFTTGFKVYGEFLNQSTPSGVDRQASWLAIL